MKEKIHFAEDVPIMITVGNYLEHPIHFHDDLEIVYLLKGKINMRNGHYSYQLKEGDIYFINEREMHSFEAVDGEPNVMMVLHIDFKYYAKYYDGKLGNNFFVSGTDSDDVDEEHIEMLRVIISKIMLEKIQKGYGYEHRLIEKGHNLISILLADFQNFALEDGKFINCKWKKENKVLSGRLMRITTYMYDNYSRKLTLNEIAEREHLSLFYLSHVIKEATGLSFQGLLNFIRVEESEKLVLDTRKKMGAISEECGFSALRYFVKHFEQWFGMPPAEYRKLYAGKTSNKKSMAVVEKSSVEEIEEAIRTLIGNEYDDYKNDREVETIRIDVMGDEKYIYKDRRSGIADSYEKGSSLTITKPLQMFKAIGDRIICEGGNFVIAKKENEFEEKDSYSIIVSYGNGSFINEIIKAETFEKAKKIIENNQSVKEFLINVNNLTGEVHIARYKTTADAILENLKHSKENHLYSDDREKIISAIRSFPKVNHEVVRGSDTILIRSVLEPAEVEMILIN